MGVGVYKKRFRFWEEGGTQNRIGEHEPRRGRTQPPCTFHVKRIVARLRQIINKKLSTTNLN